MLSGLEKLPASNGFVVSECIHEAIDSCLLPPRLFSQLLARASKGRATMPTARTRLFLAPSQALSAASGTGSAEFGSHNGLRTSRGDPPPAGGEHGFRGATAWGQRASLSTPRSFEGRLMTEDARRARCSTQQSTSFFGYDRDLRDHARS